MARILLGVSGGIAAYKALELVRLATAAGHSLRVIQTPASRRFVGSASFAALTGAPVLVAAKRARQINSYYHNLGEGTFDEFPPPMIETASKNYLTIALEEVAAGKLNYHYR